MMGSIQNSKRVRRTLGAIARPAFAAASAILIAAGASSAQAWPEKPIRLIVPLVAGGAPDGMARLTATALSARLGQPVIVENRPGGGGTLGTREVVRAAPDGYTLLFVGLNHVFAPSMAKNLDYDPVKDFAPISTVGTGWYTLVVAPSVPAKSVKELAAYAKANPGKLNWGFGTATGPHLFGEMFAAATGMDVSRIPYKGGTQAIRDLLGGHVHMTFSVTALTLPLIREGRLRALAVSSATRDRDLPDVPTMTESGLPQMTRGFWSGLLAPAGTPAPIVNRLNAEVNAILATSDMKVSLAKLGFEPKLGSPQEFAAMLLDEIATWKAVAKTAGIVPQ
jgi:tripartite-type tricarboxylate transporter receptor subunit TctC